MSIFIYSNLLHLDQYSKYRPEECQGKQHMDMSYGFCDPVLDHPTREKFFQLQPSISLK